MIRRAGLVLGVMGLGACSSTPPPPAAPAPAPPIEVPAELPAPPEPVAEPESPAPVRGALPVRLALVGDINLGTTTLEGGIPPDSGRGILAEVDSLLEGDFVVGNYEGAVADTGVPEKCERMEERERRRARREGRRPGRVACYAFATPSWLMPRLVDAGFTHLHLANNHVNDMGEAGRLRTVQVLDSLRLGWYGPGSGVVVDTLRRGDSLTVVGFVGFSNYDFSPNLLDIDRSAALVDSVRRLVDVVIVTFHGGAEGKDAASVPDTMEYLGREPRGELRRWARAVVEAGASAVIGHGPHILRGIEFLDGVPVAYSLGNFATYRGFSTAAPLDLTGVLQLTLDGRGRFLAGRFMPARQRPRQGPAPGPAALSFLEGITAANFPATGARFSVDGSFGPPPSP